MSSGPAYKSFVAGECTPEIAHEKLLQYRPILEWCMYNEIHSTLDTSAFYHVGYQKFLYQARQTLEKQFHRQIKKEDEGVIKYFYNRQLIVQMTTHPQHLGNDPSNPFHVSVPLYKAPYYELQTDILQLLPEQSKLNYNMKYLVVIVDTFTRFIWCCPVANLQSSKVQKAFLTALSRPGDSVHNYEFIRNKVQRIVIDGGSEFKSVFPQAVKLYFPNAQVITSNPKNRTGNRPTGNGPIEAAIRLLRLVMRDYSLGISPQFLSLEHGITHFGLAKILNSYNSTPQIALHEKSPITVTQETMAPTDSETHLDLKESFMYMESNRRKLINLKLKNQSLLGGSQITKDQHGPIGYRIYKPPGKFAKQVDIRVSLKVYVVDSRSTPKPPYVDLIEYGTSGQTLKHVLWNTLVLVKMPVENGPPSIYQNFSTTIKKWGFQQPTPQEITQPFYVSKDVMDAVEHEPDEKTRKRHYELMAEPLGHQQRKNEPRAARFRGGYEE